MKDQNLARGVFLALFSLAFGLGAMTYPMGTFKRFGAGLFPLIVSSLLLLIAIAMIVRSRFTKPVPMSFNISNIAFIMLALCGFALLSKWINMTAGIVFLVFVAGKAASSWSWKRNALIALGLFCIALAFQKLLGLNLPLF